MFQFHKMHGLGNDFIIVDCRHQSFDLDLKTIQKLSDRQHGVGFDLMIVLQESQSAGVDYHYRLFNRDGSEAKQCGNGVRCLAKYLFQHVDGKIHHRLASNWYVIETSVLTDGQVMANMGQPCKVALNQTIMLNEQQISYHFVDIGNQHVTVLDQAKKTPDGKEQLGQAFNTHERFSDGINVGMMNIESPSEVLLTVYERGCGVTQACGSGATAAVIAGIALGLLERSVKVIQVGGELQITWQDDDACVFMTGPAEYVFQGEMAL
jgi:diaminopimelate epimerase